MKAYLDIETTFDSQISIVGIYIPGREMVQLSGGQVTDVNLAAALEGVQVIVTFNGNAFDLPVIRRNLGIDLRDLAGHCDLLSVCRKRGIRGGLKRVEALFGIRRTTRIVDGRHAPWLWHRYETEGDEDAMMELLAYNREDCMNLEILESVLEGFGSPVTPEKA